MIVKVLIFAGGVATGLYIAKLYARSQVENAIGDALDKVGAGGGVIEETAKKILVPLVV